MAAGEDVQVDVTYPDGSLAQSHVVQADGDGNFADSFYLAEGMPSGIYGVEATGQSSGNVFATEFDPGFASLSTTSIDFGDVNVGGASADTTVTITNTGGTPATSLNVQSITLVGADPTQFALDTTGAIVSNIAVNGSVSFKVRCTPTSTGTKNATVEINTNANDPTVSVTCKGVSANSQPVVTANDAPFDEGASTSYSASWTDSGGSAQTHTCTIDFGDGSGAVAGTISPAQPSGSGTCSASHAYADGPNSYTISVSVSDGSLSGSDTATATVNNIAPTIALTGAASVNEGSVYTLSLGNVVDPGGDTVSACSIDWGDGTAAQSCLADIGSTKTHTYADGLNNYTITVDLTDEDGTFPSAGSKAITVNNALPTVVAGFAAATDCRVAATLNIDPDDAGVNDHPWTVSIAWGDGTTEPNITRSDLNAFSVTHVYAAPGTYNATVTVTDKDGGSGSDTTNSITVNQTYTVDFQPPLDDSNPSTLITNKMKNGRVVPVKATIYDDCGQAFVTDPATTVTIKVNKTPVSGSGSDAVEEYADAGQSSSGTSLFRWSDDGFWIYNLDSKALGLSLNTGYRVDIYVGTVKATRDEWALLMPVK
jgi:hypothetical protein